MQNNAIQGDTIRSVLRYVNFDAEHLQQKLQTKLQSLNSQEAESFAQELNALLDSYTYLQ